MKKFLVLCGMLMFFGVNCVFAGGKSDKNDFPGERFFKDEPGILTINNETDFDAVVFAGKVETEKVLGGIKAGASRGFDLSKIPGLPQRTVFLARVVSFETFNIKNGKVTEDDAIYTVLVVYDLSDTNNKTTITIPKQVDKTQTYFVYVSNNSPYILELRLDSPNGEKIAALPPYQRNKRIWLAPSGSGMPYEFFPVYAYADSRTNEIYSISSKERGLLAEPANAGSAAGLLDFDEPPFEPQYNVGFIQIKNDTDAGFTFLNGTNNRLKNQRGTTMVNSGGIDMFELPTGGAGGLPYTNLSLDFGRGGAPLKLNPIMIEPGYLYDLIVTQANGGFSYAIIDRGPKSYMEDNPLVLFGE